MVSLESRSGSVGVVGGNFSDGNSDLPVSVSALEEGNILVSFTKKYRAV